MPNKPTCHEPTYRETLHIAWAVWWRSVGSFLGLLFGANLLALWMMPELTRTAPSIWMAVLPLGAATFLSVFGIMPLVIRSIVRRRFGRVSLQCTVTRPSRDKDVANRSTMADAG